MIINKSQSPLYRQRLRQSLNVLLGHWQVWLEVWIKPELVSYPIATFRNFQHLVTKSGICFSFLFGKSLSKCIQYINQSHRRRQFDQDLFWTQFQQHNSKCSNLENCLFIENLPDSSETQLRTDVLVMYQMKNLHFDFTSRQKCFYMKLPVLWI